MEPRKRGWRWSRPRSPPLSKQRIGYALRLLEESHAKSWVDLGCGSGSLFDALLEQKTDLVYIAGVDISQRSLIRAAKVLHSKLDVGHKPRLATPSFESAFIYEGSITEFDRRIHGFDVATCIEVIEHMEEDQAYKFGECALGTLCPRILMVSTPNVEYNPIHQRNALDSKNDSAGEDLTEDAKGKSGLPCKFRNYDHKFEWTRKQFSDWARKLASQYGYDTTLPLRYNASACSGFRQAGRQAFFSLMLGSVFFGQRQAAFPSGQRYCFSCLVCSVVFINRALPSGSVQTFTRKLIMKTQIQRFNVRGQRSNVTYQTNSEMPGQL